MAQKALRILISIYKTVLSPVLPPSCRFHPSCSDYASEAIAVHGVFSGIRLAARRLLRCHPLNPGGFDPVPPPSAPFRSAEKTTKGN